MKIDIFLAIMFTGVIIGSYTDLKKREVPDWINYGLIFSGIGLRLIFSVIYRDWSFILDGIIGLAAGFIFACLMYYTGQWGGGDSKMLMGIGALMGLHIGLGIEKTISAWYSSPPMLLLFLAYTLFFGAIYGLIWSIALAVIRWKAFSAEFMSRLRAKAARRMKWALIAFLAVIIGLSIYLEDISYRILLFSLGAIVVLGFYMMIFIKAIEKTCMLKYVSPKSLTLGDWIAEDVKHNGKVIAGPKDLGIEQHQIDKLVEMNRKGQIDKVLVKNGIPFVPSFLIALAVTVMFSADLLLMIFRGLI